MRQTISYSVPDEYTRKTGWRRVRNRIVLAGLIAVIPLTVVIDRLRRGKTKSFWQECAARWLYLAIVARMN
jgi:hypothetical protein